MDQMYPVAFYGRNITLESEQLVYKYILFFILFSL